MTLGTIASAAGMGLLALLSLGTGFREPPLVYRVSFDPLTVLEHRRRNSQTLSSAIIETP